MFSDRGAGIGNDASFRVDYQPGLVPQRMRVVGVTCPVGSFHEQKQQKQDGLHVLWRWSLSFSGLEGCFRGLPGLVLASSGRANGSASRGVGVVDPGCKAVHLESGGCGQDNVGHFPSWLQGPALVSADQDPVPGLVAMGLGG